jgi:CRISPR system Cascade subunit CasD
MAILLLQLVGPMQSWGTTSRFDQRDTGKEPSKSGVLGLISAALGIDRDNWEELEPLTKLSMAVRHDRPGVLKWDFQTTGCAQTDSMIKANETKSKEGVTSKRYYLADAAFLIGLEGGDRYLLKSIQEALKNPKWPLSLGRKSYLPSEVLWVSNDVQDGSLREVMSKWPWISFQRGQEDLPENLILSLESSLHEGMLKMDQPLSSFSLRRFGARFVKSELIPFPQEVSHVTA